MQGCAAALALLLLSGCQPATAQGDATGCAPPPAWLAPGAKPGRPNAEMAACLKDKAYDALSVSVPLNSKVAGIIAQCEVEVDRFEPGMPFGGATGTDEEREARDREETREATAAVLAYRSCKAH